MVITLFYYPERLGLAIGGMKELNTIWKSKEITIETKIELYRV